MKGTYSNIIKNLEHYITRQPSIYDGKLIYINGILSESYFGLKNTPKAIEHINQAIELSENEETHIEFKKYILNSQRTN